MSITTKLGSELTRLIGYSSSAPHTVRLSAPDNVRVEIDLTAVDSMSCSAREIRLFVPSLVGADFDKLKQWGEAFCRRITYLLENIGPLELDENAGEALIRSTPPGKSGNTTQFYEVILRSHSGGNFSLRRYRADQGQSGRQPVDIVATHEVLKKLIADLIDTIPG